MSLPTFDWVRVRVDTEVPAAGFVMKTVIETADGHPLGRLSGGVVRCGKAQPVEVQRPQGVVGIKPK